MIGHSATSMTTTGTAASTVESTMLPIGSYTCCHVIASLRLFEGEAGSDGRELAA